MKRDVKNLLYGAFIVTIATHQHIIAESAASAESEFRVLPSGQAAQTQIAQKPFRDPGQLRFDKEKKGWWANKGGRSGQNSQGRWGRRGDIQRGAHGRRGPKNNKPENVSEQQRTINSVTRNQTNQLDALIKFERVFGKNSLNQETYNLLNKNQEAITKTIEELRPLQNNEGSK